MTPMLKSLAAFFFSFFIFTSTLLAQIPANDNCANARLIVTDSVCVTNTSRLTGQTLTNATNQVYTLTSTCGHLATASDVWYKFVTKTSYPSVSISNPGSGWGGIGNVRIQLFSGSCGSFTERACGVGSTTNAVTPLLTSPVTVGDTCYIRVHKNVGGAIAANHTFDICVTDAFTKGSRLGEIFSRTVLSPATVLNYPWEITYGRDNYLWITESKGYRVQRMDPNTGVKTLVLDISQNSTFLPAADRPLYNCQFSNGAGAQGGLAGLVLHPNFMDGTANERNWVYISYIYSSNGGSSPSGIFFTNKIVRFTYSGGVLGSPVAVATSLPGSSDHNSQRLIIAPTVPNGPKYLFYASGDMGSGQFGNRTRPMNSQVASNLEGKILRYNLDTVGGIPWIPANNPFSNAVWSIGMRNNQGFAYDTALHILYGSSHGAYSDDEINIIDSFKNYGHPLVIGYADGNYNADTTVASTRVSAGAPFTDASGVSTCPPISNETNRMNTINLNAATSGAYRGPLFSAYATSRATIQSTWTTNPGNGGWLSEGWSGLDLYQNNMIPGWNKSLVAAGLKWGRLIRLRLGTTGRTTMPSNLDSANTSDTVTYFQSTNRYRDLTFAPNGKDIFLVMDNSSATSGPGVGNPTVPACPGCVLKYSFLGYNDAAGLSTIPKSTPVSDGAGTCNQGTSITIDGSNNFLWVPITGPDGNIMAEINAMGQSLGLVTSSFYKNTGAIRVKGSVRYLDRNITITPTVTSFASPVKVRLYISKAEFNLLAADPNSGLGSVLQLKVIKNNDPCSSTMQSTSTTLIAPTNTLLADLEHGSNAYVLQVPVIGFSSFYFAASNSTLPVQLLTFTGTLKNNTITNLNWKTTNDLNTSHFIVERSLDAQQFSQIGTVTAIGSGSAENNYAFDDPEVADLQSQQIYYRLKMIDNNGTYRYSNIIRVSLPGLLNDITISPNPVVGDVNAAITSAASGTAEWMIIDNAGRVLLQNTTLLKKGKNDLMINISQVASGSYYLKVKGDGIDLKIQFQKM